jgi:hypothetical protein
MAITLDFPGGSGGGPIIINGGTVTDSTPLLTTNQMWDNDSTTFHIDTANVVNISSQPESTLLRRQLNGVNIFSVRRDGKVQMYGNSGANDILLSVLTGQGSGYPVFNIEDGNGGTNAGWIVGYGNSGGASMQVQKGLELGVTCSLQWSNDGPLQGTPDVALVRSVPGVVALTDASTGGAAFEFAEMADPATPLSAKARLYIRNNGSGKSELVARFSAGEVVLCTEPNP